jgi:hypothetical protein
MSARLSFPDLVLEPELLDALKFHMGEWHWKFSCNSDIQPYRPIINSGSC